MVAITASIACAPVAVAKCSIKPASAKAAPVKAVSNVTAKKATAFQVCDTFYIYLSSSEFSLSCGVREIGPASMERGKGGSG